MAVVSKMESGGDSTPAKATSRAPAKGSGSSLSFIPGSIRRIGINHGYMVANVEELAKRNPNYRQTYPNINFEMGIFFHLQKKVIRSAAFKVFLSMVS